MRSTLLIAALGAGACANVIGTKFVTEWTTTTLTQTVTQFPSMKTDGAVYAFGAGHKGHGHGRKEPPFKLPSSVDEVTSIPVPTSSVEEEVSIPAPTSSVEEATSSTAPVSSVEEEVSIPAPTSSVEEATSSAAPTSSVEQAASSPAYTPAAQPTAVASASTSSAASAAPSASSSAGNSYQENVLFAHNIHRSNHSASDLTWSASLAKSAQTLAERCVFEHDVSIDGGGYGQNLASGVSAESIQVAISNMMYNSEAPLFANEYGKSNPDTSYMTWGHFTQIVWKGTTEVGCFTAECGGSAITACNYSPPGNYGGAYADNVGEPKGNAPYQWP